MKAIAVYPGKPDSAHLAELPMPTVDEIPGGRGVLVRLLRCGVDGTDKEINAAEYGAAPEGFDFLVIGHENFGRVEAVGERHEFRRVTPWRPSTPRHEHLRPDRHVRHDDRRRVLRAWPAAGTGT
jgi:threonine dehydrogenase-like Zn-dependent dehydrogenase